MRGRGVPFFLALLLAVTATNLVAIQSLTDAVWASSWCDDDSLDDALSHAADPDVATAPHDRPATIAPVAFLVGVLDLVDAAPSDVPASLARQLRSPPAS